MKKNIYRGSFLALSVFLSLSATSCEDMLAPDSDIITYPEDNQINTPNDTLYSVVGTIHLMQKVADCSRLFGEVRGDLTALTKDASVDLQELSNFTVSDKNVYNKPQDYYAIINNCNYFIEHADSTYKRQGVKVFERDLAAMHSFRAWAYMQLCYNFGPDGRIPFYTNFLGTQSDAEQVLNGAWTTKEEVFDFLIQDLQQWAATKSIDYGRIGDYNFSLFAIPARLLLGELCLWRGRYEEAAQYYHDYVTDSDRPRPMYVYGYTYSSKKRPEDLVLSPSLTGAGSTSQCCVIPMPSNAFEGEVSDLYNLYNSTSDNYYHYQLTYSESAYNRYQSQVHCYIYKEGNKKDTIYMDNYRIEDTPELNGDLRLYVWTTRRANHSSIEKYNDMYQSISSTIVDDRYVTLYTLPMTYLYFAEALNRAGYPTVAFAILKYGLCDDNYSKMDSTVVNFKEFEDAGDLVYFDPVYFYNQTLTAAEEAEGYYLASEIKGIHTRGSGDAAANKKYVIPDLATKNDTILWVEDKIMEELALETLFQGRRFIDLQRIAIRRDDNDYLAKAIATREGQEHEDGDLLSKLKQRSNWYIPFQK